VKCGKNLKINYMKTDILKLVEETFGEEISTSCAETVLGLESWIEGKEAFMNKLAEKLKLLFDNFIS
jgi:hypothetical protein